MFRQRRVVAPQHSALDDDAEGLAMARCTSVRPPARSSTVLHHRTTTTVPTGLLPRRIMGTAASTTASSSTTTLRRTHRRRRRRRSPTLWSRRRRHFWLCTFATGNGTVSAAATASMLVVVVVITAAVLLGIVFYATTTKYASFLAPSQHRPVVSVVFPPPTTFQTLLLLLVSQATPSRQHASIMVPSAPLLPYEATTVHYGGLAMGQRHRRRRRRKETDGVFGNDDDDEPDEQETSYYFEPSEQTKPIGRTDAPEQQRARNRHHRHRRRRRRPLQQQQQQQQIQVQIDPPAVEPGSFALEDVMETAQPSPHNSSANNNNNSRLPPNDPPDCTPPDWTLDTFPSCNLVHESIGLLYQESHTQTKRLGEGFYRTGFLLETAHEQYGFVLKQLQMERDFSTKHYGQINREALLLGQYFVASPVTANLYAYCGGSVLVERGQDLSHTILPFAEGQTDDDMRGFRPTDDDDEDDVDDDSDEKPLLVIHNQAQLPRPMQKLELALAMLESIALLHNFPEGPIVHDDISLEQWLWSMDTDTDAGTTHRVLLNDLNSVVPLEWSESEQAYCRPPHSSSGNFRSPEFFPHLRSIGTESDMWSMGCILYCLLTGLMPYYQHADNRKVVGSIVHGVLPILHPQLGQRSAIEHTMVQLIVQLMQQDYADRPDIFSVMDQLERVQQRNMARRRLRRKSR